MFSETDKVRHCHRPVHQPRWLELQTQTHVSSAASFTQHLSVHHLSLHITYTIKQLLVHILQLVYSWKC